MAIRTHTLSLLANGIGELIGESKKSFSQFLDSLVTPPNNDTVRSAYERF